MVAEYDGIDIWYEKPYTVKKRKFKCIVNMAFGKVTIGDDYYPIGDGICEVFDSGNTEVVDSELVIDAFNEVEYRPGYCYSMAEELRESLFKRGVVSVDTYAGWMFLGRDVNPVHHCWVVVTSEDGKKSVLDLSDDLFVLKYLNRSAFEHASENEARMLIADFYKNAHTVSNDKRCFPLGVPSPDVMYVGSKMSPEDGRAVYRKLVSRFPNHDILKNLNGAYGLTKTQKMMYEKI